MPIGSLKAVPLLIPQVRLSKTELHQTTGSERKMKCNELHRAVTILKGTMGVGGCRHLS